MGLRLNTNAVSFGALNQLHEADRLQLHTVRRLSAGIRLTKASDDPSALVASEQLRAQIAGLKQAGENTEFGTNVVNTAEQALGEMSNILVDIRRSVIFALSTGGTSPEQLGAEQDAVDQAIGSIDRLAATTRFANVNLLNGNSGFVTTSIGSSITSLSIRQAYFGAASTIVLSVDVQAVAERGTLALSANGSGAMVLRVSGALGTEDITLQSGAAVSEVRAAINRYRMFTGVYASGTSAFTEDFGDSEQISLTMISGNYQGVTGSDWGQDIAVQVGLVNARTDGLTAEVTSTQFSGTLTFDPATLTTTDPTFTLIKSGLSFQIREGTGGDDQITVGIDRMASTRLGAPTVDSGGGGGLIYGYLNTLVRGGDNDLRNDPGNALRIVEEAINDVSRVRAFLGALSEKMFNSNQDAVAGVEENITASNSDLRDLDFASETADFTTHQVMVSARTAVLASANMLPQQVLKLLSR